MKAYQPSFYAIGGFVIGSAAVRILFDGDKAKHAKRKIQMLRSTDQLSIIANGTEVKTGPNLDPEGVYEPAYEDESNKRSSERSLLELPHLLPGEEQHAGQLSIIANGTEVKTGPNLDPDGVYEWAYEDESNKQSSERSSLELSRLLPGEEQHQDNATASSAVSRRTNLFSQVNDTKEDTFRLKLYWVSRYRWQGSSKETFWCMSCGNKGICKENEVMKLRNCETRSNADAIFETIKWRRGDQYRVVGKDLCLQKMNRRRTISLKPCTENRLQQFRAIPGGDDNFDLRPSRYTSRCLTNHHHPRRGEEVYAEKCVKAHKTKTGYWVKY